MCIFEQLMRQKCVYRTENYHDFQDISFLKMMEKLRDVLVKYTIAGWLTRTPNIISGNVVCPKRTM